MPDLFWWTWWTSNGCPYPLKESVGHPDNFVQLRNGSQCHLHLLKTLLSLSRWGDFRRDRTVCNTTVRLLERARRKEKDELLGKTDATLLHCMWIQRHIIDVTCRTISSMMGLTPLGKQSSTQGFDKHVTYLELQARKAITALETVKCCHEAPGEASTLWWRRPGGRLHEPGAQLWIHLYARNQAMHGTFCNLLILKRSPSAVHETPKHPSLNLWGLGWLAHQHPSCASFPTFQSNACWLTKSPMLASDLFRKSKKALEPGGPFWRSLPTWVWPAHVTLRLGQNWSCMIHDLK